MADVLITPLPAEFKKILTLFQNTWESQEVHVSGRRAVFFPKPQIYLASGGLGKTEMALWTQFWLQSLKDASAMACVGCAGSLDPQRHVGTVVVGTKTIEHDFKSTWLKLKPPEFVIAQTWQTLLSKHPSSSTLWAPIASGDEDVLSERRRHEIADQTQAKAVAWEGAGAARACAFLQVPFCEIRAISDDSSTDLSRDFAKNFDQALAALGQWLISLYDS